MMIAAFVVLGLVAVSAVFAVCAIAFAPVGYQDENGFHYGPNQSTKPAQTFAYGMAEAKAAA
jgi:hypothetical protein